VGGNASYGSAPIGTGNAKASQLISKQGADRTLWSAKIAYVVPACEVARRNLCDSSSGSNAYYDAGDRGPDDGGAFGS
jgi:hypothetical protein